MSVKASTVIGAIIICATAWYSGYKAGFSKAVDACTMVVLKKVLENGETDDEPKQVG